MTKRLILPLPQQGNNHEMPLASDAVQQHIQAWLNEKIDYIKSVFQSSLHTPNKHAINSTAQAIVSILTQKIFNFQSKKNIQHLLTAVEAGIMQAIENQAPLHFVYLYNGAYRASCCPQAMNLIFEPDQTELMLLYQIALLQERVKAVYAPGIQFTIVLNNGVAHWVNQIPLAATTSYANAFRKMIQYLNANNNIRLLVQSELSNFNSSFQWSKHEVLPPLSGKEHHIIERFTGRSLLPLEAAILAHRYTEAETTWFNQLNRLPQVQTAILMRQVADTHMLSFRPFPGGAIRAQNGSLGFELQGETILPKLITSENSRQAQVSITTMVWPWQSLSEKQYQAS